MSGLTADLTMAEKIAIEMTIAEIVMAEVTAALCIRLNSTLILVCYSAAPLSGLRLSSLFCGTAEKFE
jgi:hypothetical protein